MTKNLKYTRVSLNITLKGFPVGEIMNCHFWVEGNLKMEDAREKLNAIDFNEVLQGKRCYHGHTITALTSTVVIPENDNLSDLIVDSVEKKPLTIPDIKLLNLTEVSDVELDAFKKAFIEESFKRRYKMSDGEYAFYKKHPNKKKGVEPIKQEYRSKHNTNYNSELNINRSIPLEDTVAVKKQKIREKLGIVSQ